MSSTLPRDPRFLQHLGATVPLICGAMYPCSNPELVAAVAAAGGVGIIQPISMSFVHGHDLREGIRLIRRQTDGVVGFNALVEKTSKVYEDRMKRWVDIALEEGIRFFVTALGKPDWVVKKVHAVGGIVYHDASDRRWAERALASDVDGLICVNARAGGHAGAMTPEAMYESMHDLGVPLVCAGGVGSEQEFVAALEMGYAAVQMGTRFIATRECQAHADYKRAIVDAKAEDVVLTERISGIPVAVINTPYVQALGLRAGPIGRRLLQHPRTKHYARMLLQLRSGLQLKRSSLKGATYRDVYQAGKSVDGIEAVEPAGEVVARFAAAAEAAGSLRAQEPKGA